MGEHGIFVADGVDVARTKLQRSVASSREIAQGEVITEDDIHLLSPGDGFSWSQRGEVIGKTATEAIARNEIIYANMVKDATAGATSKA